MRHDGRSAGQIRPVTMTNGIHPFAEGSCLIEMGATKVLATASVEKNIPAWLRGSGRGWITAEYAMLPRSNRKRSPRERTPAGRSQEIQRLVGRSLRAVTDLSMMPDVQVVVDCDVLVADGGTRCASITAAYVALHDALKWARNNEAISADPLIDSIAAISAGIVGGRALSDLNYDEDSQADVDGNVVFTGRGRIVEIQMTAEKSSFDEDDLAKLLRLAKAGAGKLRKMQMAVLQPSKSRT